MHPVVDLNYGSGFVYGRATPVDDTAAHLNTLIDAALVAADRSRPARDYLGASRIGEPCSRKLVYEVTRTPKDDGKEFEGAILRIFDAGHRFEDLCICWLRAAGFDLRTWNRSGEQFGFAIADDRIRGHIDGVIIAGPDVGVAWPALWAQGARPAILDGCRQTRRPCRSAGLLRAGAAVHGVHAASGGAVHRDQPRLSRSLP